jgi:hypothetical protein
MTRPDEKDLRLLERDVDLELPELPELPEPLDAAESRWDPWLLALAQLEAEAETPRLN